MTPTPAHYLGIASASALFFETHLEPVPNADWQMDLSNFDMTDRVDVVIVASAFGMDAVRAHGHLKWAGASRQAGAAGFEVRRELFADETDAALPTLRELGERIAALGLWCVYSTPASLYAPDGTLDAAALRLSIEEALALGARFVKLQLGGFAREANAAVIADHLRCADLRLVVENGQLAEGGSLDQFVGLFDALAREGHAGLLGMTFDIGNWAWRDVAPLDAAGALAAHVDYIHCKTTAGEGARRFPAAPAADDAQFAAVLDSLPRNVPRGIEFPFEKNRIDADAARYVAWLAAA
ncbi:sugar phosphate isomerase/epimerase [Paraburkholderia bryophila]|uniref:Sugar phosphate isomerase/epimerase n=2 Tax=Paraburkholderia bryophila TaxID=420952 RepID=A0A329CY28_9BURK|nr:sugar phosphate isomerase/epimerase [Paraburkholderia bryophila]